MRTAARRPALPAAAILVAAALVACGKKGPPLPPLGHRPEPIAAVEARQEGTDLVLSLDLPARYTDGAALEAPPGLLLVRESLGGRQAIVRRFSAQEVAAAPGTRARLAVPLARVFDGTSAATAVLRVAAEGKKGKPSAPSPPITVERADPPPPPERLEAAGESEGVELTWSPGAAAPEGLLYNVFRRAAGQPEWGAPLNPKPLRKTRFMDRQAAFGASYDYRVEAVAPGGKPARASFPSAAVSIERRDTFPPPVPAEVRAVAGPEGIRIFWFPPEAADVAGLRVYRAAAGAGPERIAELPPTASFYLDDQVIAGATYAYTVTAFDGASPPNESAPSQAVSETAAPLSPPPAPSPGGPPGS